MYQKNRNSLENVFCMCECVCVYVHSYKHWHNVMTSLYLCATYNNAFTADCYSITG